MEEQRFPRMRYWPIGIGFFCFTVVFLFVAVWGMSDGFTEWKLPFWEYEPAMGIFIFCFLLVWFSIPIGLLIYMSQAFQTIRLDREEVRLCIGPWVLRRIPCREIRTVVRTGISPFPVGRGTRGHQYWLVLCTDDLRTLQGDMSLERLKDRLDKGRTPGTLVVDWSSELEEALQRRLSRASFVV